MNVRKHMSAPPITIFDDTDFKSALGLMQKHRILSQVAGYHTEVIKFLPPITITKEDCDWFLAAMQDVLEDSQRFPGAAWDTVAGLAVGSIRA